MQTVKIVEPRLRAPWTEADLQRLRKAIASGDEAQVSKVYESMGEKNPEPEPVKIHE